MMGFCYDLRVEIRKLQRTKITSNKLLELIIRRTLDMEVRIIKMSSSFLVKLCLSVLKIMVL